jgi:hypothetical protein
MSTQEFTYTYLLDEGVFDDADVFAFVPTASFEAVEAAPASVPRTANTSWLPKGVLRASAAATLAAILWTPQAVASEARVAPEMVCEAVLGDPGGGGGTEVRDAGFEPDRVYDRPVQLDRLAKLLSRGRASQRLDEYLDLDD